MNTTRPSDVVRRVYSAYETGNREEVEAALADDFIFSSPPDPHLNRQQYFERCWPNNDRIKQFKFRKVVEQDGEVFVTYEIERTDGSRGRNTEYFVVEDQKIKRCDVYFGPSL